MSLRFSKFTFHDDREKMSPHQNGLREFVGDTEALGVEFTDPEDKKALLWAGIRVQDSASESEIADALEKLAQHIREGRFGARTNEERRIDNEINAGQFKLEHIPVPEETLRKWRERNNRPKKEPAEKWYGEEAFADALSVP